AYSAHGHMTPPGPLARVIRKSPERIAEKYMQDLSGIISQIFLHQLLTSFLTYKDCKQNMDTKNTIL
ncbi:hypothetical protein HPG69_001602, partial [Diceros bicornis minor]